MNKVWHYAPWAHLPAIVSAGELRRSNALASLEKPLLWFSSHQIWEPTATKFTYSRGSLRRLTFKEQAATFGCVRFGLPSNDGRLLQWKRACSFAGTPREDRRSMELAGKKLGACRDQWLATASDIPLATLTFQVWLDEWDAASLEDMAKVWTEK